MKDSTNQMTSLAVFAMVAPGYDEIFLQTFGISQPVWSVSSRLRRISSISRSYLFGIAALLPSTRQKTLLLVIIPTFQRRDKYFVTYFQR